MNLLLVDDHQMVLDGLKSLLSGVHGINIAGEAINGQEALNRLASDPESVDMVITDISMPLMSGTELCRQIKTGFPHIRVLILSMYTSDAAVRETILAEADGYLLKTAGRDELLTAIQRVADGGTWFTAGIFPVVFREHNKAKERDSNLQILTTREQEILALVVEELTSEEIAARLNISRKTVDNHRQSILLKTGCRSTIGLVKFAIRNGMEV